MKFNLIDKVESLSADKIVAVKYVSLAEEYLADHFPTFPVLPGVMMLEAATLVFEVGGASATSETRRLDRHWRNARTAASHNPAIHREAAIGDHLLNGTVPDRKWREVFEKRQGAAAGST